MNFDLNAMSVAELKVLDESVKSTLKAKRAEAKESGVAEKAAREAEMRANVGEGAMVAFMFNKKEAEGKVVKVSEKSVTVEFNLNGETVKRYRKYSDLVKVL